MDEAGREDAEGFEEVNYPLRLLKIDGSQPLQKFLAEHNSILRYLFFITNLVTNADHAAVTAAKAIANAVPNHADIARYKRLMEEGAGHVKFLQRNRDLFIEMILCRAVDNYLVSYRSCYTSFFWPSRRHFDQPNRNG